jgi:hypothetical protein
MIEKKTNLSFSLSSVKCKLVKMITENALQQIEDDISSKTAESNAQTVKKYVQYMDSSYGNFSELGMWKLKNQLCPTSIDPPMAKQDKSGTLVSAPNLIRSLYLDTYT